MHAAIDVPVLVPALVFLGFAFLDWKRLPVCGRISLGAATACVLAALPDPSMGVNELVAEASGMAYLVALARVLGAGAVLFSVALAARERLVP